MQILNNYRPYWWINSDLMKVLMIMSAIFVSYSLMDVYFKRYSKLIPTILLIFVFIFYNLSILGQIEYIQVVVNESTKFNEITDNYKIIKRNQNLWTLEPFPDEDGFDDEYND